MLDNEIDERFKAVEGLVSRTRSDILNALPKDDSSTWRIVSLALPTVLTALLGLVAYIVETRLTASIKSQGEAQAQTLRAQLVLTQDYYRERLQTYKDVHKQVVALKNATAQTNEPAPFDQPVASLYDSYSNQSIFISATLLGELTDLWNKGIAAARGSEVAPEEATAIATTAATIENQMRADLRVPELDQSADGG